jgi:RimJ/RimL family protein N-acetyltransferase
MNFNVQPTLGNALVNIRPLQASDFEALYQVASDPLIWEQHPNKDRYKREVFGNFFKGAMESGGAFLVFDSQSGTPIGSTRFYDLDIAKKNVLIGYTFLARSHWGKQHNPALKTLMLNHAFEQLESVIFHIGAVNIRSQKAIERLGAKKVGEIDVEYYGEPKKWNFIYEITKREWEERETG